MQPRALSQTVLAVVVGLIALALAWVAGLVYSGLQGATVLVATFVLVVVATMFGPWHVWHTMRAHPLMTLLAVAAVLPWVVIFLVSPTYIVPMGPRGW